jgi:hypothetical protein
MPGTRRSFVSLSLLAALAFVLAPSVAHASSAPSKATRAPSAANAKLCAKAPVEIVSGGQRATFPLATCDGGVLPSGVDELSNLALASPAAAAKATDGSREVDKSPGVRGATGTRRIDPRLVERLQRVVDHFAKPSIPERVVVVSAFRPRGSGSYHSTGRALDFRIDGVDNDALDAFCRTLPDTGCGLYPHDVFVHMDVRDSGTGHVAWIDKSRRSAVDTQPAVASAGAPPSSSAEKVSASTDAPDLSMARPLERSDDSHGADPVKETLPALPTPPHRVSRHRVHKKRRDDPKTI